MTLIKGSIILPFLALLITNCDDKYKAIKTFQITVNNNKAGSADTVIKEKDQNFYFSRLTKKTAGGLNATFFVPPENQRKDIYVVVSGRIRSNYAQSNSTITFAATSADNEVLAWKAIFLRNYYTNINQWCYFKDSIFLKESVNGKVYNAISAFAYSGVSESENFDMDTLKIEIKEKI